MTKMTHFDSSGAAHMVDVGGKAESERVAVAQGQIHMQADTQAQIAAGTHGKGDVLGVARLAGIMAAKQTSTLIPLCHPLPLKKIEVTIEPDPALPGYVIEATVKTKSETGVEMEALTAVSIAALTVYDMCKAADKGMTIEATRLLHKSGGNSGTWESP